MSSDIHNYEAQNVAECAYIQEALLRDIARNLEAEINEAIAPKISELVDKVIADLNVQATKYVDVSQFAHHLHVTVTNKRSDAAIKNLTEI